jgi:hypothetical protein
MRKKLVVFTLFVFSIGMYIPVAAMPEPVNAVGEPQIRVQIGRGRRRNRGRHLGWYKGRRAYYYNSNPYDRRYVRDYYYVNGRRYVRWYWNY